MNLLDLGKKLKEIGEKVAEEAKKHNVNDYNDCPVDIKWDYIQKIDGSKHLHIEVELWAEGPAVLCQEIAGSIGVERKI